MGDYNLGKTISNLIVSNNLNQLLFAKSINVNQSQVSDWISGKSKPSYDSLRDICIKYNISADELLGLMVGEPTTKYKISNRRYTGSKLKLKDWIKNLIIKHCKHCDSFCDIFAGTGIITDALLEQYDNFILNDFLFSNEIIYKAFYKNEAYDLKKLMSYKMNYDSLDYDNIPENYVSQNFGGKYFEVGDARAIGYIRQNIEDNKDKLNDREYSILIASLLYSFDKCANTVGHYEAYFKGKDIQRSFVFDLITPYDTVSLGKKIEIYREDANTLASSIYSDIVYIDPPYSSRQYSRFYHVLENITKWEKPLLFGTALKPPVENMSVYCSISARKAFEDLVSKLHCKYIVVSYNNTYNSKSSSSENKITLEDLFAILSNKGRTKVYETPFKAFNAGKTEIDNHKEMVFITEVGIYDNKEPSLKKIIRSPFFYVGDKYKLMKQLLPLFPQNIDTYYEPFCGGGSSFLNVSASKYILNDIDPYMIKLHKMLNQYVRNPQTFFEKVRNIEENYGLSASYRQDIIPRELKKEFAKTYIAKFNKAAFEQMRKDYNEDKTNYELLYVLLIYGFNRMLRFNAQGEFNLPVGNVDFNSNVVNSLYNYFRFCNNNEVHFLNYDFREFLNQCNFNSNDFVYVDPPYLIANSEYNKIWKKQDEKDLLQMLDKLNKMGVKFAISNLLQHNRQQNDIFIEWSKKYNVCNISSNYINYHDNTQKSSVEVLVKNY